MRRNWLCTAFGISLLVATPAMAEVTRFEIVSRGPAFEGRSFGASGPVEIIIGRATIAVDPENIRNTIITDLDRAPRTADGRVEATADVVILRPRVASGAMLVELPNRGRPLIVRSLQDGAQAGPAAGEGAQQQANTLGAPFAQASDAGNGFAFEQGLTVVEVGWQADIGAGEGIGVRAPIIQGLTGPSRETWSFSDAEPVKRVTLSYPAAGSVRGNLSVRLTPDAELTSPPGLSFRQIDPLTIEISRPAGLSPRAVYEFNYTATDPVVMGMGFAALRDVASFLKFDESPSNPLAGAGKPTRAIASGISQSGRALRDFLYQGFNADERGRQVFDGMVPIVPGARRSFTNFRFGQPGRNPGPQNDRYYPVAQFPFAYAATRDPVTGRTDGLLLQCGTTGTCPKIMQVDSEYEFWGSQAGMNVIDPEGRPLPLPAEVRAFMIAGAPHSAWGERISRPSDTCKLSSSPVNGAPLIRALMVAMAQWLEGTAPPESRYPSLTDGTLAGPDEAYSAIGPLPYNAQYAKAYRLEQTANGPLIGGVFPLSVPRAGPDGNAVGGVRTPMVEVPRATYTGWNPMRDAEGPEDLCTQAGGALPFANTRAQRLAANDSRLSLEEFYPSQADYVARVRAAADALVAARLLLPADAAADVRLAQAGRLARLSP